MGNQNNNIGPKILEIKKDDEKIKEEEENIKKWNYEMDKYRCNNYEHFIKIFMSFYSRFILLGKTGAGKSRYICDRLFKSNDFCKRWDNVIIFTRKQNEKYFNDKFKDKIKNIKIYTDADDIDIDVEFPIIIKKIINKQRNNIYKINEEGYQNYKSNIIIIFDDILSDKILDNPHIMDLYCNSRKLQISVVFSSQITGNQLNTMIKGQTSMFIFFKIFNDIQMRFIIDLLKNGIMNKLEKNNENITDDDAYKLAKHLYLSMPEYQSIIIDDCYNIY